MPTHQSSPVLVVVPCGKSKIWDRQPNIGAVRADEVYTGGPFVLNRKYAERFGDRWVVLSAKYGLIPPDFIITEPYEVTFKNRSTNPVGPDLLRSQIQSLQLGQFPVVIGLGGREYRLVLQEAFGDLATEIVFPFAGLGLGKSMRAVKQAISSDEPYPLAYREARTNGLG